MARCSAILLLVWFAALSLGAVSYVHDLQHAWEDRAAAAGDPASVPVDHDATNCFTHAQLHLPVLPPAWVPVLICLGLWVAFVSTLSPPLMAQHAPQRVTCRGPPVA